MIRNAATLELGGPQAEVDQALQAAPRGSAMKFVFASGSRPLDGYTIKRGIGRGGFGEVYFAASDAGKEVALKHVERNLDVELRGVSQCLNLKHINLVDLYDVRYDDHGDAWVVMEYIAGQSLKDAIDRNPNGLPLEDVLDWFHGIAAGVQYLHDYGIVHRDLKPGNIFEDGGTVKIGDYGLSKFISCSRRSGQTESVGTCHYMAPEIGKGVYGKEIDIYALGIMLYEMITGRVPFDGESSQEIIMKHLTADPDVTNVPQPYRAIIQRAMHKDPQQRFADVEAMLSMLPGASGAVAAKPAPRVVEAVIVPQAAAPHYIGDEPTPPSGEMHFGPVRANPKLRRPPLGGGVTPRREEPIAKAVKNGACQLSGWWNNNATATPIKLLLLAGVVALGVIHGGWLIPVGLTLVAVYAVYIGLRTLVAALNAQTSVVATSPAAPVYRSAGWQCLNADQQGRELLAHRTFGERASELSGSLLASAGIAAVLTLVMLMLGGSGLDLHAQTVATGAWLWLLTTAGAWIVLAVGKFTERCKTHEFIRRRFAMLVLGMAVGALAFGLGQFLMLDSLLIDASRLDRWQRGLYAPSGQLQLPAYLAYFGSLFVTLSWWKQTDPLRRSRFSVGPLLLTFLAAFIWNLIWPFPEPWGYFLPVAVSIAVQLSAPWLSKQQRFVAAQRPRETR